MLDNNDEIEKHSKFEFKNGDTDETRKVTHVSSNKNDEFYPASKLRSPTNEEDYIRSTKVHTYHGKPTHYYRDEPKHDLLLAVKVCVTRSNLF